MDQGDEELACGLPGRLKVWPKLCHVPYIDCVSGNGPGGARRTPGFDVVAVVASLGGVAAVGELLAALPPDLPAAVVVLVHRSDLQADTLLGVFANVSALPMHSVTDGDRLQAAAVHLIPAKRAVTIDAQLRFSVRPESPASRLRPADPLFISIATVVGRRAIAVVLTGRLDDGALGARHIKGAGGRVLVQEPQTCASASMPDAALRTGCVDYALPLPTLAAALTALIMAPGAADLMRVGLPDWATPIPPPAGALASLPG